MAEVDALSGRRARRKPQARAAILRGPDRAECESSAAIRADVMQMILHALCAEGALVGADHRFRAVGRKILVAIFAIGPELERHQRFVISGT